MSRSVNNMTERPIRAATSLGQGRARTPRPNSASKSFSGSISDGAVTPNASRMVSLDGRVKGTTLKGTEKNALQVSESGKTNAISEATNQDKQPLSQQELLTCSTATGLDHLASSAESLSSDCTSETQDATRRSVCTSQGSIVPARFWQETNSRCKGISEIRSSMPEAELSSATSGRLRSAGHSGAGRVSKSSTSPWAVSGSQSQASPLSAPQPSISPVKVIPSSSPPSRCLPSPTRSRGQPLPPHPANSLNIRSSSTGSVLNFSGDARKGKKGPSQLEDAHLLRLLHNRQLQWRFINARAEAAMNAQTVTAEKMLSNVWVTTSELRDSVTMKRIELQQARQENKLKSVLSGQVEGMSSLVSELAGVAAQERALLDQCGDLLATAGALEVEESSLRAHLIQLKQDKCGGYG